MNEIELVGGWDRPDRIGDLVFLHGLNGDARKTWATSLDENEIFWPQWLADDIPDVAVWTLGYEASPSAWFGSSMALNDRAINLLWRLNTHGIGKLPICFVAHSLGGLIVKRMLFSAETTVTEYRIISENTCGVVFFDTPHQGAKLANIFHRLFKYSVLQVSLHYPLCSRYCIYGQNPP